jgi:hypothetical protein
MAAGKCSELNELEETTVKDTLISCVTEHNLVVGKEDIPHKLKHFAAQFYSLSLPAVLLHE